ncbi:DUF3027 domain-containing protein [Arthrobacter sp. ATA002]|uniref:DUF3027 domain-containing protein n=1 Tax=Arthrobacter sp. ATA002 TaxID=2991715 RepID=UPI0022A73D66|nr:DUF3027 domain-containing protein [Arthrobacter sp. ATA002]WAP51590.1 DUF3027 domain-containing protein [Arthrobacter sp. ATA002]
MTMSATSSSDTAAGHPSPAESGSAGGTPSGAPAAKAPRRAPRRPSKPDAVLAAAVETARAGLLEVVPADQIGPYAGAAADAERLVTHRFEALRPGYNGWQWYATVARVPRGKVATVCEVGLLPSENAVMAPEWVPWSERVRPEDVAAEEAAEAQERADALAGAAGGGSSGGDAGDGGTATHGDGTPED